MISVAVKLTQNNRQLERLITQAMRKEVMSKWQKALPQFVVSVRRILRTHLIESEDYKNMTDQGSELKGIIGLGDDAADRLDEVVTHWLDGIDCKLAIVKGMPCVKLTAIRSTFTDVLGLPAASYTTENGFVVPFLDFVLTKGTKPLIRGFYASDRIGLGAQVSRSGTHLMREKAGAVFQIPAKYAGDRSGNWVTRSVDKAIPDIVQLMEQTFS